MDTYSENYINEEVNVFDKSYNKISNTNIQIINMHNNESQNLQDNELITKQSSYLSSNSIIDVKFKENYCDETLYTLIDNLINYKTSLLTLQKTYIQHNLLEKNRINLHKIKKINDLMNTICDHKWITDYIDYPDGEGSYPIIYCVNCELNKEELNTL